MEAQNLLLLDLEQCTRCDDCVKACADAHDGVTRLVRDGLRFDKFLVATSCRSCLDPLCMVGCPVGSIRRTRTRWRSSSRTGASAAACAPPTARTATSTCTRSWCEGDDPEPAGQEKAVVREKATTCDLSRQYHEPACVYACPHDALKRVEPAKFFGIPK